MLQFALRRILLTVPIMLVVATLVFLTMRLGASDPAAVMAGEAATRAQIEAIREHYGFDQSIFVQFLTWLSHIAQGDLGRSIYSGQPVATMIAQRMEPTVALAILSMVIAILIAIPLGTIAAVRAGTWVDRTVMIFAVSAYSFPVFLISYTLVLIFALNLNLVPVQGYRPLSSGLVPFLSHLALPAITLGLAFSAQLARITRATVIEILGQDFIRTARAKGLHPARIVAIHALRNAGVPIITVIGLSVAGLISGVVVTETIFALPGIGRLTVDGILYRDYPVVQACVLFFSLTYILINLLVDLAYAAVDPRIRY